MADVASTVWIERLREARMQPELGDPKHPEHAAAALELAVALGWCRLTGTEPGDLDGTLPADIAGAAWTQLVARLTEETKEARTLDDRYTEALEEDEELADDICLTALEEAMDAQAAMLAIQEASWADPSVEPLADQVTRALSEYSDALWEQRYALCAVHDHQALKNWAAALDGHWPPPWWLQGHLQAAAKKLKAEAARPFPSVLQGSRRKSPVLRLPPLPHVARAAAAVQEEPPAPPVEFQDQDSAWLLILTRPVGYDPEAFCTIRLVRQTEGHPEPWIDTRVRFCGREAVEIEIRGGKAEVPLARIHGEGTRDLWVEVWRDGLWELGYPK